VQATVLDLRDAGIHLPSSHRGSWEVGTHHPLSTSSVSSHCTMPAHSGHLEFVE
jgi:hypothetical protein